MRLLYMPFGLIAAVIGARAGRRTFALLWGALGSGPKPTPGEPDASLGRVMAASALEAATLAAAAAAAKVLSARVFHYLFGAWPQRAREHRAPQKT